MKLFGLITLKGTYIIIGIIYADATTIYVPKNLNIYNQNKTVDKSKVLKKLFEILLFLIFSYTEKQTNKIKK